MKLIILIFLISINSLASFLPKNELLVPINELNNENKYEQQILAFGHFISLFDIEVEVNWLNNDVNAFASIDQDQRKITLLGGLLRHSAFNETILNLILCHEAGHHLGGVPFKKDDFGADRWSSVEGKSDFYATNLCLKDYYAQMPSTNNINKEVQKFCNSLNTSETEYQKCLYLVSASLETSKFAHKISGTRRGNRLPNPSLLKTDKMVVSKTLETHPTPQCRLDTFVKASIVNEDNDIHYPSCWYHQ